MIGTGLNEVAYATAIAVLHNFYKTLLWNAEHNAQGALLDWGWNYTSPRVSMTLTWVDIDWIAHAIRLLHLQEYRERLVEMYRDEPYSDAE